MLSAIAATLAIVAIGYALKQQEFLPDTVWQSLSPLWIVAIERSAGATAHARTVYKGAHRPTTRSRTARAA